MTKLFFKSDSNIGYTVFNVSEWVHKFLMEREDGKETLTVTTEAFKSIFRVFGEYDEKDLV